MLIFLKVENYETLPGVRVRWGVGRRKPKREKLFGFAVTH